MNPDQPALRTVISHLRATLPAEYTSDATLMRFFTQAFMVGMAYGVSGSPAVRDFCIAYGQEAQPGAGFTRQEFLRLYSGAAEELIRNYEARKGASSGGKGSVLDSREPDA